MFHKNQMKFRPKSRVNLEPELAQSPRNIPNQYVASASTSRLGNIEYLRNPESDFAVVRNVFYGCLELKPMPALETEKKKAIFFIYVHKTTHKVQLTLQTSCSSRLVIQQHQHLRTLRLLHFESDPFSLLMASALERACQIEELRIDLLKVRKDLVQKNGKELERLLTVLSQKFFLQFPKLKSFHLDCTSTLEDLFDIDRNILFFGCILQRVTRALNIEALRLLFRFNCKEFWYTGFFSLLKEFSNTTKKVMSTNRLTAPHSKKFRFKTLRLAFKQNGGDTSWDSTVFELQTIEQAFLNLGEVDLEIGINIEISVRFRKLVSREDQKLCLLESINARSWKIRPETKEIESMARKKVQHLGFLMKYNKQAS